MSEPRPRGVSSPRPTDGPARGGAPSRVSAVLARAARIDPALRAILALFLLITAPRIATVPIWDARTYYDNCLLPALNATFNPLRFNCFGHPSMLYMALFAPGQWLTGSSAVALNLTNIGLGCLAIAAFWCVTGFLWPAAVSRIDRVLATAIFAVWPSAVANSLNPNPDYGVFVFFLLFLSLLLCERFALAAIAGAFLVFSKETGVALYGLAAILDLTIVRPGGNASVARLGQRLRRRLPLLTPVALFLLESLVVHLRRQPVIWTESIPATRLIARFLFFNPSEIFVGKFGPAIWVLNFSWILTASLVAAGLSLALGLSARKSLGSGHHERRTLLFLSLLFVFSVYLLTRYETYVNVRYLLAIAPLLVLLFVVALSLLGIPRKLRGGILGATFLLMLGSNFRTLDPVSRVLWGTFPFGRHQLLKLTSWSNECCGFSRDQLVYNLEYLKFHEIQNAIFADLRPTFATTLLANPKADFFLGGAITDRWRRTLRVRDTLSVHYLAVADLDRRRVPPTTVYFVAFPNFDNGPDLQRLRRFYRVSSVKSYERSGYAISVYTMNRRDPATGTAAITTDRTDHIPERNEESVLMAVFPGFAEFSKRSMVTRPFLSCSGTGPELRAPLPDRPQVRGRASR